MHRNIVYITPLLQHDFLARRERVAQFEQQAFTEQEASISGLAVLLILLGIVCTAIAMVMAA